MTTALLIPSLAVCIASLSCLVCFSKKSLSASPPFHPSTSVWRTAKFLTFFYEWTAEEGEKRETQPQSSAAVDGDNAENDAGAPK